MANKIYTEDDDRKKDTKDKRIIDWQTELVNIGDAEWKKGQQYVDDLNELYDDLYQMLRGQRPDKNYDWQSNVVINKVFQVVWTTVPYILQKIFGATPIIGVKSFDKKGAWQRREILEYWRTMQSGISKEHMPYFLVWTSAVLRAALNGTSFIKKGWWQVLKRYKKEMKTEVPVAMGQEGTVTEPHNSTYSWTEPVEDWPTNQVINNRDLVVDWLLQPGQSIRQGRFVIHRINTDLNALQSSRINYINLDKLDEEENTVDSEGRQDHSQSTGLDNMENPPSSDIYTDIEIKERQGLFPVYRTKKDGYWMPCFDKEEIYSSDDVVFKEMIMTWVPSQKVLIRFEPNKYEEKTYIDLHLYLDTERWQSTGQVEPIKDLQTAISDNINATFDEIWQNLMQPVVVNKFALWDWDTMEYAPRQRWLVGGNPNEAIMFRPSTDVTKDAWQKHMLLENIVDLTTSVTPPIQGMGQEKAATTNIMNAQMSAGKLDFLIKMIEITGLIPDAQMDVRFAKKFAHPKTFEKILGEPFQYGDYSEEIYKFVPAASSVKLEHQKRIETQEDIQLLQIMSQINNPNTPKILNAILANILRNRDRPAEANLLDEKYFEPQSEAGNMEMLRRQLEGMPASNEKGIPMGGTEKGVRQLSYNQPGRAS